MTEENDKQLGEQLAQLTRWEGKKTQLWREALDTQPTTSFMSPKFLSWRIHPLAAVIAIVGGLLLVATFTLPELGKARNNARTLETSSNSFAYYEQPDAIQTTFRAPCHRSD